MRVSLLSTLSLLCVAQNVSGFSVLPSSVRRTATASSHLSSAAPKEKAETTNSEDTKTTEEGSSSFTPPPPNSDMHTILSKIEKRVTEGPGSLSFLEVQDLNIRGDRLIEELENPSTAASSVEASAASTGPELASGGSTSTEAGQSELYDAAIACDSAKVTELLEKGLQMNDETVDAAFWAVVQAVNRAEEQDQPLSADIPVMLHHVFDADMELLKQREKNTFNVTCMQPLTEEDEAGAARRMNYIFDDYAHQQLPLEEGRRCEDGRCCDACSRNIFPTFASPSEINFSSFPELGSFSFNNLEETSAATILQFTRLIERVRRTIAYEYGLPLKYILPLQAYSRKYVAGTTQQGGGGGEGDFVILHTDEATHAGYHYSCVLYLSTQGEDFEGGNFVFNDPDPDFKKDTKDPKASALEDDDDEDEEEYGGYASLEEEIRYSGRKLTPFGPTRGSAVIFSSGWENMHEVEKITKGIRYAVPCFFTTSPVPEVAYEQMAVGKPKTNEDIADDWLHLLLAHRAESPMESVGRVKELLMKWHFMCAPLSEH